MAEKYRLLQAEGDPNYRQEVGDYFRRLTDFDYLAMDSSVNLVKTIEEQSPQIILLDLKLPPWGGLPALEQIRSRWNKESIPVVLFSQERYSSLLAKASELGATYCILRPIDLTILEQRLRQILVPESLNNRQRPQPSFKEVQEVCINFFDTLGIPPQYKGHPYLIEGIYLAILHQDWLGAMTTKLYPAVGQRFGASPAQVERAMRYALDITWEKGNLAELYRFFPYEIGEKKGKPTNGIFIAKMADLVSFELE